MDALLDPIRQFAISASGAKRRDLISSLHDMAYSLETADDTLHRYGSMHLQTASVKIGLDLNLFRALVDFKDAMASVEELADKTGAQPLLLVRLLRYLAAIGAVQQVSNTQFSPNHITKNLVEKAVKPAINHYFETVGPVYQAFPAFLNRTGYKIPIDGLHTVFQEAWKTDLHTFQWLGSHATNLAYFNDFMAFRREPELSWLSVYPILEQTKEMEPGRALYVNVGGGIGHQCAEFKKKFPDIPGRVVLQDMPHSIANAIPTPGVENMAHDFFQPQPIKGAKFYFLRGVFHNHPSHKVLELLEQTKAAMAQDSVMLIDEQIPPEMGGHVDVLSMDLTMMTAFAGMERPETYWRNILAEVGLTLVNAYVYNAVSHETVLEVHLAD